MPAIYRRFRDISVVVISVGVRFSNMYYRLFVPIVPAPCQCNERGQQNYYP